MGTVSFGSVHRISKQDEVPRWFIMNAVREGRIPGYLLGRRTIYVRRDDVLALLETRRVEPTPPPTDQC